MYKYTKWLALSIVFLAAAFIMPIYVLYSALNTTLQEAVNTIPDYASNSPQTGGVNTFLQAQTAAQVQLLIIVIAVEAVLIASFSVTLWHAIKCRDNCRNYPPL
ncbi:MAG TPA: hypothetical protein VJ066_05465 [Candidatus Bathyarchaeia archaeon]|nr:hypothetical protein [Candidatus Bathyarchaeia archaeon]